MSTDNETWQALRDAEQEDESDKLEQTLEQQRAQAGLEKVVHDF